MTCLWELIKSVRFYVLTRKNSYSIFDQISPMSAELLRKKNTMIAWNVFPGFQTNALGLFLNCDNTAEVAAWTSFKKKTNLTFFSKLAKISTRIFFAVTSVADWSGTLLKED